jgi:hypothetical protein
MRCPKATRRPEALDLAEHAEVADGAAADVEASHTEHDGADGLGRLTGRRGWLGEEEAAPDEVRGTAAIGEEPEVADPHEAVRDDVEEKAPEEHHGLEVHDLDAISVGVVSPAETDSMAVEVDQAVV